MKKIIIKELEEVKKILYIELGLEEDLEGDLEEVKQGGEYICLDLEGGKILEEIINMIVIIIVIVIKKQI